MVRITIAIGACILATAAGRVQETDDTQAKALSRLEEARVAMGGAAALAAVETVRFTGTLANRNQWFGKTPGPEFLTSSLEIKALMPDRYVARNDLGSAVSYSGFAGQTLLNRLESKGAKTGEGQYAASMLDGERAIFARLMLTRFLRTDTSFPLSVKGLSGDSIELADAANRRMLLELDPDTKLPQRLRFVLTMRDAPAGRQVSAVMDLGDYRRVDKLLLAHKETTWRDGVKYAERVFDTIEINPSLGPEDFKR